MALTVKKVAKLIRRGEQGRHIDSGPLPAVRGLYLVVVSPTSAFWELRFQINKRARSMGIGSAFVVTLAEARERARDARLKLIDGVDPLELKKSERSTQKAAAARVITFADAAAQFLRQHEAKWHSPVHAQQWVNTLAQYVLPVIGPIDVAKIDTALVLQVIEPHWASKTETMMRVRNRIEQILAWCKVRGYRTGDNPAEWRGHLDKTLPARHKIAPTEHLAALPYSQLPAFMAELRKVEGTAARALEFTILTAARVGEVIKARRSEIDWQNAIWNIPAAHMLKRKQQDARPFPKPLPDAAIELLRALPHEGDDGFLFIGSRADKSVNDEAILNIAKRVAKPLGYEVTTHGFRSAFKDWTRETTAFPNLTASQISLSRVSCHWR